MKGLALILLVIGVPITVTAHDWYPMECCSGLDCAPAKFDQIPTQQLASNLGPQSLPSVMMVTTRYGSVVVPANFPVRQSKDGGAHACMRQTSEGTMRLLCLFLPPSI